MDKRRQSAVQVRHTAQIAMANDVGNIDLVVIKFGPSDVFQNVFGRWVEGVETRRFFDGCDDVFNAKEEVAQFSV